jgi:plastocyanin
MQPRMALGGALMCTSIALAACYSSTRNPPVAMVTPSPHASPSPTPTGRVTPTPPPTPTPFGTPTPTPSGPTPTPTATAQPQVVHIGFELLENTDPTYGPVWYYSPTLDNLANVVRVAHGSQLVFVDDGTNPKSQHTAAGLGTNGFPPSFDNLNQFTQSGTVIDGGNTWSTGILNPGGGMSQVFTVSGPGVFYFGCGFHYAGPPTQTNQSMGDVIVSQ